MRGELTPYRFMVRAIVAHRSSFSKFDRVFTTSTMTSTTRNVPDRSDAVSRYSTVGECGDLLVTSLATAIMSAPCARTSWLFASIFGWKRFEQPPQPRISRFENRQPAAQGARRPEPGPPIELAPRPVPNLRDIAVGLAYERSSVERSRVAPWPRSTNPCGPWRGARPK